MHGLVSLLPQPHYSLIEKLWQELESQFGLQGVYVTPFPHFSWQIAQEYDFDRLEQILVPIAARFQPLTVRTTGIGLFTGIRPVIFIPVVKEPALLHLHQEIWEASQPAAQGLSPYYSPPQWIPHITLALEDISAENIGPVMQSLAFRSFNWEMTVDNIALGYQPEGEVGAVKFKIMLQR